MTLIIQETISASSLSRDEYISFCLNRLSPFLIENGLLFAWSSLYFEMGAIGQDLPHNDFVCFKDIAKNSAALLSSLEVLSRPRSVRDDLRYLGLISFQLVTSNDATLYDNDLHFSLHRDALEVYSFFCFWARFFSGSEFLSDLVQSSHGAASRGLETFTSICSILSSPIEHRLSLLQGELIFFPTKFSDLSSIYRSFFDVVTLIHGLRYSEAFDLASQLSSKYPHFATIKSLLHSIDTFFLSSSSNLESDIDHFLLYPFTQLLPGLYDPKPYSSLYSSKYLPFISSSDDILFSPVDRNVSVTLFQAHLSALPLSSITSQYDQISIVNDQIASSSTFDAFDLKSKEKFISALFSSGLDLSIDTDMPDIKLLTGVSSPAYPLFFDKLLDTSTLALNSSALLQSLFSVSKMEKIFYNLNSRKMPFVEAELKMYLQNVAFSCSTPFYPSCIDICPDCIPESIFATFLFGLPKLYIYSPPVLPYLIFTHFFLYGFSSVHISSSLSDILSHLINSLEMLNSVKSAFPSRVAFYPGSFSFDFSSYQYDLHQKLKDFFSTSFFNTYHVSSDLLEMYDSFYAELYALQDDISYSESLLLTLQV